MKYEIKESNLNLQKSFLLHYTLFLLRVMSKQQHNLYLL